MADIFTPVDTETTVIDNPLEALVGEGKKFKDAAALAAAKLEADNFIKQLQRENAEAREKLSSQATVDEIMTQIKALAPKPSGNEPAPAHSNPAPATPDDITKLVSDVLNQKTAEQRLASNRDLVNSKVLEKWGADAQININKKAKELNVSIDYLQSIASQNPSVFFELVGLNRQPEKAAPVVAPRSPFATPVAPAPDGNTRNHAYYETLKSRDFNSYITPKIQNQMMKDALAQGESFWG